MDFELPLIMVAKKKYLEDFQSGILYMKNCLCYQLLEEKDLQRGDKYDSAISCGYDGYNLPDWVKQEVTNPRLMSSAPYIKCFFHYNPKDIKRVSEEAILLQLSNESAQDLLGFSEEYALFIGNPNELVKRFSYACNANGFIHDFSDVTYVEDKEYISYEDIFKGVISGKNSGEVPVPVFRKRDRFHPQQEFRLAVFSSLEEVWEQNSEIAKVDYNTPIDLKRIISEEKESIEFKMQPIHDISKIVKLSLLTDYSVIMNIAEERYYFGVYQQ